MAARVCGIADELNHADDDRQRIVSSADEMRAVSAALEVRRAEAQSAAAETERLLAEKESQTAMLAQHVERLSQLAPQDGPKPSESVAGEVHEGVEQSATQNGERRFSQSVDLITVLGSQGFISRDEAAAVLIMIRADDVDKFVRSLWSRAMGGPLPGPYRLIIGTVLADSGDHKGAMTFFNKALESKHVDPFMTYLVAVALLRLKRYVDVLRIAQALGRSKNGKVLSRNIDALHLWGSGRLDEAEQKLAEALTIPGHPKLHYNETLYNLARLAEGRGDAPTAAMWFEKLAAADASHRDVALHMDSLKTEAHAG
jgi:tetratricopeptide (TPR) repeat protein